MHCQFVWIQVVVLQVSSLLQPHAKRNKKIRTQLFSIIEQYPCNFWIWGIPHILEEVFWYNHKMFESMKTTTHNIHCKWKGRLRQFFLYNTMTWIQLNSLKRTKSAVGRNAVTQHQKQSQWSIQLSPMFMLVYVNTSFFFANYVNTSWSWIENSSQPPTCTAHDQIQMQWSMDRITRVKRVVSLPARNKNKTSRLPPASVRMWAMPMKVA